MAPAFLVPCFQRETGLIFRVQGGANTGRGDAPTGFFPVPIRTTFCMWLEAGQERRRNMSRAAALLSTMNWTYYHPKGFQYHPPFSQIMQIAGLPSLSVFGADFEASLKKALCLAAKSVESA